MSGPAGPHGLCVVDKPSGWTSHDVVARARGRLGTRKVGHSGTLDPMATGVLVLGVGSATRLLTFLSGLPKVYRATIRLGVETDSLDADGDVTVVHEMEAPAPESIRAGAASLTGSIEQVPPMVSAVKVGGKRLYQLARDGVEVERAARPVTVHRFEVTPTEDPMTWDATVACSSGTYVRVLAADLGRALGGGAHLSGLRRTEVGPFAIDEAHDLESLRLLPSSEIVRVLEPCPIGADVAVDVDHGKVLPRDRLPVPGDGPWAVIGPDGELMAVYVTHRGDTVKPALVIPPDARK